MYISKYVDIDSDPTSDICISHVQPYCVSGTEGTYYDVRCALSSSMCNSFSPVKNTSLQRHISNQVESIMNDIGRNAGDSLI